MRFIKFVLLMWRAHRRQQIKPIYVSMLGTDGYFVSSKPHGMEKRPQVKGYILFLDSIP